MLRMRKNGYKKGIRIAAKKAAIAKNAATTQKRLSPEPNDIVHL